MSLNIGNHVDQQLDDQMASPNQSASPMQSSSSAAKGTDSGTQVSWFIKLWWKVVNFAFQILTKPRLQELVREIDPTEQLDEEVEEILLQIADDFIENTVNAACLLAKHRKVPKVEVKDVQLHLERNWNMWIPGFGTEELRPYKRAAVTEAHKQRLALIKKAIKKY